MLTERPSVTTKPKCTKITKLPQKKSLKLKMKRNLRQVKARRGEGALFGSTTCHAGRFKAITSTQTPRLRGKKMVPKWGSKFWFSLSTMKKNPTQLQQINSCMNKSRLSFLFWWVAWKLNSKTHSPRPRIQNLRSIRKAVRSKIKKPDLPRL